MILHKLGPLHNPVRDDAGGDDGGGQAKEVDDAEAHVGDEVFGQDAIHANDKTSGTCEWK